MTLKTLLLSAGLAVLAMPAAAEIAAWMSGEWRTNARLTAPDGAQLRIRCTLEAAAASASDWTGTLGCATVQGRFTGEWQIAITGGSASGQVVFSGAASDVVAVSGTASDARVDLASGDGQGVAFAPGTDGALIVEMQALGPQRLTGALSFEPR
ncbi:hypothetical protein [Gymnodinialimonas ulvae]|uniref:hypothetical protein n=1 Tax=Gymnodinialimonas ulvae TaxID=3126504 RepID=UPI00309C86D3